MALRAVLVGAGPMGRAWARALLDFDRTDLAGWCDLRTDLVKEGLDALGRNGIAVGDDLSCLLADVKPDFVVDATSPESHFQVVTTSLDRSIPVLGEKPMAHSIEAARQMVAASRKHGALYMVSQSRRYNPMMVAYRDLIAQIGQLGILNVDFQLGPHFGGFRDAMPSPLLLDMAIHTFDQARFLTGADPQTVYCEEFNPAWSWYAGAAAANALFTLSGGIRLAYRGSWCAEGMTTSWDGQWRAVGSDGTALWDGDKPPVAELVTSREGFTAQVRRVEAPVRDHMPSGIAGSLREFVQALAEGGSPQGECQDNIKSLAMVFGAIESAQTGSRVDVARMFA